MFWRLRSRVILLAIGLLVCSTVSATKKPPPAPINLNTATSAQLQQVPGIGPSTADKILQMRKSYGPFKSVNDLLAVRGIGPKKLEKMRKYLVAGKVPPKKPVTSAAKTPAATGSTVKKPPPASSATAATAATKTSGPATKSTTVSSAKSPAVAPAKPTAAPAPVAKAKADVADEEPQ